MDWYGVSVYCYQKGNRMGNGITYLSTMKQYENGIEM